MTVVNVPDTPTANDDNYTVIVDSVGDELDVLDNDTSAQIQPKILTVTSVTAMPKEVLFKSLIPG